LLRILGLLTALGLLFAGLTGVADAKRPAPKAKAHVRKHVQKRMTAKKKAQIRRQLRKQVRKNPGVIGKRAFIKKASLVDFVLPVTLRLRGVGSPTDPANSKPESQNCVNGNYAGFDPTKTVCTGGNPNNANIDLGASLGQRTVALGGSLSGNIVFHDSYDGGALGNVDLELKPSTTHRLTTTSIPLLWNTQVSSGRFDANDLGILDESEKAGCQDFTAGGAANGNGASPLNTLVAAPFGADGSWLTFAKDYQPAHDPPQTGDGNGLPGYPYYKADGTGAPAWLPIIPGVDDIKKVRSGDIPGDNDIVGPSDHPFPSSPTEPMSLPKAVDTVLRTNALQLDVAKAGDTVVNQSTGAGPNGSQNVVIGKSGGQANLFGSIPGKENGIDITVSLSTKINSIIRVVDQDSFHNSLKAGETWPAGVFNCHQVWTGQVQNYIPGVHLTGNLKISPGLTSDGHLRIAKATVSSPKNEKTRFAVAACLSPMANYAAEEHGSDSVSKIPDPDNPADTFATGSPLGKVAFPQALPTNQSAKRGAPQHPCNSSIDMTELVRKSGLGGTEVQLPQGGTEGEGYTTSSDGSKVSVAADLKVTKVAVDVLIGNV
jgi:hypothetical protein